MENKRLCIGIMCDKALSALPLPPAICHQIVEDDDREEEEGEGRLALDENVVSYVEK